MNISKIIIALAVFHLTVSDAISSDREQRLIDHAYYCLTNELIFASKGTSTERPSLVDCQAAELGLAYIGEKKTKVALNTLAKIRRYKLDGAMSESYMCYVLSKGTTILKIFQNIDFQAEQTNCESEVGARLMTLGVSDHASYVTAACSTPNINVEWLKEIRAAIRSGSKCDAENW